MARRKEINAIAQGLIGSFISRKNDVDGYWGIGKLYAHMLDSNSMTIEIDLLKKSIEPKNEELQDVVTNYHGLLTQLLAGRGLKTEYIQKAVINLIGFSNEPKAELGKIAPHRMNCRIEINDDLGKVYSYEKDVWCRRHSPKTERQSSRARKT